MSWLNRGIKGLILNAIYVCWFQQAKSLSWSDTEKIDLPKDISVDELQMVRKAIQESVGEEHVSRYPQYGPIYKKPVLCCAKYSQQLFKTRFTI